MREILRCMLLKERILELVDVSLDFLFCQFVKAAGSLGLNYRANFSIFAFFTRDFSDHSQI